MNETTQIDYVEVEKSAQVMEQFWLRMAQQNPERSTKYNEYRLEARNVWQTLASYNLPPLQ